MSLLVKDGTVVGPRGKERANLLLRDGIIESVTTLEPDADEVISAAGFFVLPGVVDPHVHFRQPGMDSEDWGSGSKAAVAGGVTTVLDMPNTRPPCITSVLLEEKLAMVNACKPLVNYGFHFGATSTNQSEIEIVKAKRCSASVKIFMGSSTGELLVTDTAALKSILNTAWLATVHAEDECVIKENFGAPDHGSKRPKAAALSAIRKLSFSNCRNIYICHITSYDEAEAAISFYKEVTPHHLFLNEDVMNRIGSYGKVNPPLRPEADRAALWTALAEGKISTIGSDHAPHLKSAKESDNPPSGVPGVETSLPLMLDAASRGMLTLEKVVELMCQNPSRIFKLKGKGFIEQGYDADLAIVDLKCRRKVSVDGLHSRCGWTPFDGFDLRGWPVATIVGGSVAYMNGEFFKSSGREVTYAV